MSRTVPELCLVRFLRFPVGASFRSGEPMTSTGENLRPGSLTRRRTLSRGTDRPDLPGVAYLALSGGLWRAPLRGRPAPRALVRRSAILAPGPGSRLLGPL